jgi:UDP-glucose 4-epimerase
MQQKKIIIVTGGAGFVGSNLIEYFIKKTHYQIVSIDNYSSGLKKNHIKNKRVKYIKSHTQHIDKVLKKYKNKINCVFHFGEFSRIYQSFLKMDECINSNSIGTNQVIRFCLTNNIRFIYSATSASLGNNGDDKNLSPYAFTKSKNLEFIENLKKWFGFKYEVIYFYNVYGNRHIRIGDMATVIGIFENHYLKKKPLPIVRPGNQSRRFTHIEDTVEICYIAWKKNREAHYSISNKKSYSIIEVAKLFNYKIKFLPKRPGERYASALTRLHMGKEINRFYGKKSLKNYIKSFIKTH